MHIHILLINPLIPRREILLDLSNYNDSSGISIHSSHEGRYSNTAQKSVITLLQYYQKSFAFLVYCSRNSQNPRTNNKNNSYSSANPLQFSCELPVRTRMVFAIHSHLLHSYHITSSDFMYLLYSKNHDPIFLHVKQNKVRIIIKSS